MYFLFVLLSLISLLLFCLVQHKTNDDKRADDLAQEEFLRHLRRHS